MEDLLIHLMFAGGAAPAKGGTQPGFSYFQCLMPLAILGIFYALLIRPQRQQQKQHANLVAEIKSGTRVVAAGMVGTITSVKKASIILKSADAKVELDRNSIERILGGGDEENVEEDDETEAEEASEPKKKSSRKKKKKKGSQD